MPEHRCVNVGAISCKGHFQADTMEELLRQVAKHLKDKHAVATPTQTVMNYVMKMAGR